MITKTENGIGSKGIDMTLRRERKTELTRRTLLAATAGGVGSIVLAGCTGSDDNEDDTEGTAEAAEEEPEQDGDESEENLDSEDVENRDPETDVLEYKDLEIIEHEAEEKELDYSEEKELVISGIVENHDDEKYDSVFVGVRAYDEDGHQLDQYLDSTSNLQGTGTWRFEIKVYDYSAAEVASWDIGVWGSQY